MLTPMLAGTRYTRALPQIQLKITDTLGQALCQDQGNSTRRRQKLFDSNAMTEFHNRNTGHDSFSFILYDMSHMSDLVNSSKRNFWIIL
jgi:hypothetical protein